MNLIRRILAVLWLFFIWTLFSCGGESDPDPEPPTPPATKPDSTAITINTAAIKQEMIGFGGALTWYSNWVTDNNKANEIADLMFTDLGIDIIRFKNWYYPGNYPSDKSTVNMPDDNARVHWDATNKLYELAKARDADVKILLSSWGPPKSLKSNDKLQEGTLKKDGSDFMYDAFADYWVDVLDHVPFNPDYISIQNEPTYVTSGWTTCEWSINETSALPGYNTAFNKVYDKIKIRAHVPVMMGPESQDIPKFTSFANVLKDNVNCGLYAFHPYNINSGTGSAAVVSALQSVGNFSTKLNLMTEFSDNLDWLSTALFIHNALVYANTSGYVYWKLAWSTPASGEDAGMISISSSNATASYKVTPYYYLIKHFAKHVDAGYHRVEASSSKTSLYTSAFISPDSKKLTIIAINNGSQPAKVYFEATGKTIGSVGVTQSVDGSYYKTVDVASPGKSISLPAKSITTVALGI
ncbi:MAG TPA: glycoside hydrolase family 30 beta sandwich domain-containing protein [Chryseolinea sp.]|nr:glycoside hydrolase family 30 beta sandwich domain-containing protein [Chryseolinea sp.]